MIGRAWLLLHHPGVIAYLWGIPLLAAAVLCLADSIWRTRTPKDDSGRVDVGTVFQLLALLTLTAIAVLAVATR